MFNDYQALKTSRASLAGVPAQILVTGTMLGCKIAGEPIKEQELQYAYFRVPLEQKGWSVDSVAVQQHPTIGDACLFWVVVNGNTSDNLNTVARNFAKSLTRTITQYGAMFLTKPVVNNTPQPPINIPVNNGQPQPQVNYPDFIVKARGTYKNYTGAPDGNALLLAFQSGGWGVTNINIKQAGADNFLSVFFPPKLVYDKLTNYDYDIGFTMTGSPQSVNVIKSAVQQILSTQFDNVTVAVAVKESGISGVTSSFDAFATGLGVSTPIVIGALLVVGIIILKK